MRREFLIARILSLDIELVPVPKLAEIMHQVNEIYNETFCNTQINCKLSIFWIKEAVKKIVFFFIKNQYENLAQGPLEKKIAPG